jgi:hypothetical protein
MAGLLDGVFWASLAILVYTYAGYLVLVRLLANTAPRSLPQNPTDR